MGHITVMLNLVQHPLRIAGCAHSGCVGPWTLNQVQGDEGFLGGGSR